MFFLYESSVVLSFLVVFIVAYLFLVLGLCKVSHNQLEYKNTLILSDDKVK